MKIEIEAGGLSVPATLYDNAAARDLGAMLPLTLTLEDYAETEKVAKLPGKLGLEGMADGFAPSAGDITHYAPWGNVAIFHKPFRHSAGLVSLGRIDGNLDMLRRPGPLRVTIRRVGG